MKFVQKARKPDFLLDFPRKILIYCLSTLDAQRFSNRTRFTMISVSWCFGISQKGSILFVSGLSVGTPFYLPPESADPRRERTGEVLQASDIWSIGVITYVMVTGKPPFFGKSR
jgi:serine/threonine protein kinase